MSFFSCDWLCDQRVVEAFVKEAALKLVQLERWVVPAVMSR